MFKRKDDIKTFIVVACICIVCIIIGIILSIKSNVEKLEHVNQYNVFFSNVNYLNNYISKIASADNKAVYGLLNNKYIEENNITIDNVLEQVGDYSILSSFDATEMYYVQVKDDFIYYIKGNIYEDTYDDRNLVEENFSIIIITDVNNLSYSIYPVDDKNNEKIINSIKKINIENNKYNSIVESELINKEQICVIYLSDFIDNIYNNINSSYDSLSDTMKKIYPTSNDYKNYINNNFNLISSAADKCKLEELDDKRKYTVIDTNGNTYIFNEEYIMNYEVDFYLKEVSE